MKGKSAAAGGEIGKEVDQWVPLEVRLHVPEEAAERCGFSGEGVVLEHAKGACVEEVRFGWRRRR